MTEARALLIDGRCSARTVDELAMECGATEIPRPTDSGEKADYWISAVAEISGELPWLNGRPDALTSLSGSCTLAVTRTMVFAIVAPDDMLQPACWFAGPKAAMRTTASGQQGFLRKRPSAIDVVTARWSIELGEVSRLFRSSNQLQTGQEKSLVVALN